MKTTLLRTVGLVALACASGGAERATAQAVVIRVASGETSAPVVGALAYLVDSSGETVRSALTDERGRALFVGIAAGSYRVRAEMIGMATGETGLFSVGEGMSVAEELRLASSAIELEGIAIEADSRCRVRPGGEVVADVWDEARKALSAAAFTDSRGTYRYETMTYVRDLDRDFTVTREEESRREGYMLTPFESLPADSLVHHGFVQPDGRSFLYYAPDATVLLSDAFLDTHCFRLVGGAERDDGLIGLAFEPTGENRSVPDIGGTMWLDAETAELQWLEYTYRYLDPDISSDQVGGRVDFRRMPEGTWIVPEWWIRMPAVAQRIDGTGRRNNFIQGYRQTGGVVLEVREAGGRQLGSRFQTGAFEGVVLDSVGVPIQSVRVGVVGSNQQVFTNAQGRYGITNLNPGRYQVRFVDPWLESIGYVPEPVTRDVLRGESTTLDYHMPSLGDVLFEACRGVERPEGSAILAGQVTDRRGRLVVGATVRVEWSVFDTFDTAIREERNGAETVTDERGAYRICGVEVDVPLRVRGSLGEDQSEEYELYVPDHTTAATQQIRLSGGR